jgi:hypothetical protein
MRRRGAASAQGWICIRRRERPRRGCMRTGSGCSAPAFFAIAGGSWGVQIGDEGIDPVMIIQDDRGMRQLSGGDRFGCVRRNVHSIPLEFECRLCFFQPPN